MNIIGLSGYARSGKDEAAKVLVEEFGFERIAFADKLRDFLYALNPRVEFIDEYEVSDDSGRTVKRFKDYITVQGVIDAFGWDGYKETEYGTEVRALLQRLGTEAGRGVLWDSIWIDAALHNLRPEGKYVVTDARFPNEAEAIRERDGRIWRIVRSGVGPANSHPSETSLDDYDFDYFVHNDATLEDFRKSVKSRYLESLSPGQ